MDKSKAISVYNGDINVVFVSGNLSKVLHGGSVTLSLDTVTINDKKPTWKCIFSNVHSNQIDMSLLSSLAKCEFK